MDRVLLRTAVVVLVVGLVGTTAGSSIGIEMGGAASAPAAGDPSERGVEAGDRMVGAVDAQEQLIVGVFERASFRQAVGGAETDESKAAAIATYLNASATHLDTLAERKADLERARERGEIDEGEYQVRIARVVAEAERVRRLSSEIGNAAEELPAGVRRGRDITSADVRRVRNRARDMTADVDSPIAETGFGAEFFGHVETLVEAYNSDVDRTGSGVVFDQLRGERVDLRVRAPGGSEAVVSFRVGEDGRIEELRAGARGDATLELLTDRETVERAATADDPRAALRSAVLSDRVRVRGIGPINRLKWGAIGVLKDLIGLL